MTTYRVAIQVRSPMQRLVVCECGYQMAMFGLQDLDRHLMEHRYPESTP